MQIIQMTVRYPGAGSVDAILLGAAGNIIRLAMDGWADAAEFRLVDGQWLSEDNEPVEIDSKPEPQWEECSRWLTGLLHYNSPMPATPQWVN